jgi:hypothetical protein
MGDACRGRALEDIARVFDELGTRIAQFGASRAPADELDPELRLELAQRLRE